MKTQTLEQINGNTCVHKILSMIEVYVPEDEIKHYNCNGLNRNCEDYTPVNRTEIPIENVRYG